MVLYRLSFVACAVALCACSDASNEESPRSTNEGTSFNPDETPSDDGASNDGDSDGENEPLEVVQSAVSLGDNIETVWPNIHVTVAPLSIEGSPSWYQVAGPEMARIEDPNQATARIALPTPGLYTFRLVATSGDTTSDDEITVQLLSAAELDESSTAVDILNRETRPVWRDEHRLPTLNRHDFGVGFEIAKVLATDWQYNWLIPIDTQNGELYFSQDGYVQYHLAQEYAKNPTSYRVTPYFVNVLPPSVSEKPASWPDQALLRDSQGEFIDFDPGPGVRFILNPLAPDSFFKNAGTDVGKAVAEQFLGRNIDIDFVADQGEWGLSLIGWAWDAETEQSFYVSDPLYQEALNQALAEGVADEGHFLSLHIARQIRLVKDGFYEASGLDTEIQYVRYDLTGYGSSRGRYCGDVNWNTILEDTMDIPSYPSDEYYLQNRSWTASDGVHPTDMMHQLLNNAMGQLKVIGHDQRFAWISAGWDLEPDSVSVTPRDEYIGFMKMMYLSGVIAVFQDDYSNDARTKSLEAQPMGAASSPQVDGWIDAAHINALFSHFDEMLLNSELVTEGTGEHPYNQTCDPVSPKPLGGFRPAGDDTAWVLVRKVIGQDIYLIGAFAGTGEDRSIEVDVPGLGPIAVQARTTGSLYTATYDGETLSLSWIDEELPRQPTRLWFGDGPGVEMASPPSP